MGLGSRSAGGALLAALGLAAASGASSALGPASVVVEAGSGAVLHAHEPSHPWYPASLAKMMTLYLAFGALQSGRLTLGEPLEVSAHAAAQPDSRLGLRRGETITVGEAILAAATQSANDAAVVLAERLAGSEASFSALMTEQARLLGMRDTVFRNATGLPQAGQVTTAHDMALLALALLRDYPQYYHFFGERYFRYRGAVHRNTNPLLGAYAGADGMKTGFTCGSGYNLVASAKRGDRRLIGVVLGAASRDERTALMTRLLDAGFQTPAAGRPGLAALASSRAEGAGEGPPFRLQAGACRLAMGAREASGETLPGWGLLFGVFAGEAQARRHLAAMRDRLRPVLRGGTPAVLRRQVEDITTWKALLVGLERSEAVTACLYLIESNHICLVQPPLATRSAVPGAVAR